MKYKRHTKKSGRNKTIRPKGDSDPSGVIGLAVRRTPAELKAFEDFGVVSEHLEESYLAVFLACWLCKFVFPKDDVNLIHPGVFKVASKMAAGESFSLAIPVLANIYDDLNVILNLASTEDRAAVLPYHYVYGWLGEYFGTHFSSLTLDKSGSSSPTSIKLGPLMTKYFGVLSGKSLDDSHAQTLFKSCEGLRMDRLARVGSVRRGIMDDSHLRSSDLSYPISLRSTLKEKTQSESLQAVYMHWESCTRACTNAYITLPANDEFRSNSVTRVYARWWSKVGPSCSFDLTIASVHSYTDMLLGGNLPTNGEIGDPPGAELVQNSPNFPSLLCVNEGVQESIIRPTPLPASSAISLRWPNLSGTEQFIHHLKLRATLDVKNHIESRISKCSLEDLALLEEDLSKLVSTINNLNIDSLSLRIKIAELMAASTEYSSLRAISLKKLSPDDRAQQLAAIDLSLARVWSSQQVTSGDYQVTEASLASVQVSLDALVREREQLGTQASQLENVLAEQRATFSQHHEEISRLEQEKGMAMDLPILSPTEVETLKTLEGLLKDRLRSFRDISFQ
ncbi:unnamed protein product [Malus baccata var. baccata]